LRTQAWISLRRTKTTFFSFRPSVSNLCLTLFPFYPIILMKTACELNHMDAARQKGIAMSNRNRLLILMLLLIVTVVLSAAAPPFRKVRVTVVNKTGQEIMVKVDRPEEGFVARVEPGTKVFTVTPGVYRITVWACGGTNRVNNVDLTRNFRVTVPKCYTRPANVREINMRKFLFNPR